MVIGLVVIGLLLIVLGIWIIRQTRVDLDVLAPLERMGDKEWKKRDRSTQRRMLDEVRPDGAQPLVPAKLPPSLDAEFELAEHPVTSFSDLGPGVPSQERDPTPIGRDVDPVIEPIDEPVAESVVEIEDAPIDEPVAEAVVEIADEPVSEVVAEIEGEPVAEVVVETEDEPVIVENEDEPVAEVVVEIEDEPVAEVVVEIEDEPVPVETDVESSPDAEPASDARN